MTKPRLQAELTLDDTKFHAGLRKVQVGAQRFSTLIGSKLGAVAAGGLAAAGTAIAATFTYQTFRDGIKGAIDAGERLNDLRATTGATVSSLSRLSDVFEAAGVPADSLETSIHRMQKAVFAAQKDTKALGPLMDKLGINFYDFQKLSPDQQFIKLGKAINALPSATERSGTAIAIFGRGGAKLLETFENFNDLDFANLDRRAAFFQKNATDFDRLNTSIRKAKMASQEFFLVLAAKMLPTIEKVSMAIGKMNFGQIAENLIDINKGATLGILRSLDPNVGLDERLRGSGGVIGNTLMGGVKEKKLLPGPERPSQFPASLIPSSTGGIDEFKKRGVHATLPLLQPKRLAELTEPTSRPQQLRSGLISSPEPLGNAMKQKIGIDSVFLGPSKFAGGVRKRGESKEEFRARMDAGKRGDKGKEKQDQTLEGYVKRIADLLDAK